MSDRKPKPTPDDSLPPPAPEEISAMSLNMIAETLDGALAEWESPSDQRVWLLGYVESAHDSPSAKAVQADECLVEYRKRFPADVPPLPGKNLRDGT